MHERRNKLLLVRHKLRFVRDSKVNVLSASTLKLNHSFVRVIRIEDGLAEPKRECLFTGLVDRFQSFSLDARVNFSISDMYLREPRPSSYMRTCHVTDFSNGALRERESRTNLFRIFLHVKYGKSWKYCTKVETYLLFCHFNTILKLFTVGPEHK